MIDWGGGRPTVTIIVGTPKPKDENTWPGQSGKTDNRNGNVGGPGGSRSGSFRRPEKKKRNGDRLVAELRGNLPAILELEDELYNAGAGSPVRALTTSNPLPRIGLTVA